MRFFLIGLVTATCSLVTVPAFAYADVDIRLPGNDGGTAQIETGDPAGLSAVLHAAPDNPRMDTSSFTEAATDLTAGTMRCKIAARLTEDNVVLPLCESSMDDIVTFHGPAGTVDVLLTMVIDGTITASLAQPSNLVHAKYTGILDFADPTGGTLFAQSMVQSQYDELADGGAFTSTVSDGGGSIMTILNSQTATVHARMTVTVGVPVEIDADLIVNDTFCVGFNGDTVLMDFGNTARLAIDLPAGYTYTSETGNFLTDPGAPGLGLPPDGGTGVTGLGDGGATKDGGGSSGGDASIISTDGGASSSLDGGNGSGSGAASNGSGDDGGCNSSGSTSDYGAVFAIAGLVLIAKRRRARVARTTTRSAFRTLRK